MNRKLLTIVSLVYLWSSIMVGQVGINTIVPTADLEIRADSSPGVDKYNGIIIPKVAALPVVGSPEYPTATQSGLLLYLDTIDSSRGVYLFNGSDYIKLEPASASGAFFNQGTSIFTSTTTDNIERQGNVSIGSGLNSAKLNIDVVSANSSADPIGIKVENNNTGTGSTNTYGIFSENNSSTGGAGVKYGLRSDVSSSGDSDRVGIYNNVTSSSGSNNKGVIGINNVVGATTGTSSTNIGIRSEIGTSSSNANSYGILSIARGSDAQNNYSGYFQGDKFAIRNEDDSDGYELPTSDGTADQVLTTNGSGTVQWQDARINPIQLSLWQGGIYDINNLNTLTNLVGIESIIQATDIAASGNLQIKLVIWVTEYASTTNFELLAFDSTGNQSTPIVQSDLNYQDNVSGGFVTSTWQDYDAGTTAGISQFILRGLVSGSDSNAKLSSAYLLIRPR